MAHPMLRGAQVAMSGGAVVRSLSASIIGVGIAWETRNAGRRQRGRQNGEESSLGNLSIHSHPSSGAGADAPPGTTTNNEQLVYNWRLPNERLQYIVNEQTDSQIALLDIVKGLQEELTKMEQENKDLKEHMETDLKKAEATC